MQRRTSPTPSFLRALSGGAYVCFGDRGILGYRSVKVRSMSLNAFESINYPNLGTIAQGRYIPLHTPPVYRTNTALMTVWSPISRSSGSCQARALPCSACCRNAVAGEWWWRRSFGLGGVHNFRRNHIEAIEGLLRRSVPVVLTTQCLYEYSNPGAYEVSHAPTQAGVISAKDMTTEAAVTKLMWVMGKYTDMDSIHEKMQTGLCGEIL